jgi:hypothetical protein
MDQGDEPLDRIHIAGCLTMLQAILLSDLRKNEMFKALAFDPA